MKVNEYLVPMWLLEYKTSDIMIYSITSDIKAPCIKVYSQIELYHSISRAVAIKDLFIDKDLKIPFIFR